MELPKPEPLSVKRRWLRLLIVLLVPVIGLLAYRRFTEALPVPPPVLGQVPPFSLVERSGRKMTLDDFKGRIWVADFVFTVCAGPCPIMSQRMRALQDALREAGLEDVLCVSVSVDPDRDTPAVLTKYAERYGADQARWLFFTGKKPEIYELAISGFKLTVEDAIATEEILHSTRFVLVDGRGRIRGYYDALDDDPALNAMWDKEAKAAPGDVTRRILADVRALKREEAKGLQDD